VSVTTKQIPLDLDFRPAYSRDDLFVGDSNKEAVAMIDLWPNWKSPALVLYGEEGSGKRHLASVWKGLSDAMMVTASEFESLDIALLIDSPQNIIIEQLHLIAGHRDSEEKLFHLYNKYFLAKTHSILLTSRVPSARLQFLTKDIMTRLTAAPNVHIDLPSEDLIGHIIGKQLYDHGMVISSELLSYATSMIGRSWRLSKLFVRGLHDYNLTHQKPITQKLIRDILLESEEMD
jgi:chromosomal replication initiation ATPase DnaA